MPCMLRCFYTKNRGCDPLMVQQREHGVAACMCNAVLHSSVARYYGLHCATSAPRREAPTAAVRGCARLRLGTALASCGTCLSVAACVRPADMPQFPPESALSRQLDSWHDRRKLDLMGQEPLWCVSWAWNCCKAEIRRVAEMPCESNQPGTHG